MRKISVNMDGAVSVFWVVAGMLTCYGATQLGLGGITDPGAGFIFFWSGLILVLLSLIVLIGSFGAAKTGSAQIGALNWAKIALVLASLFLYGFLLERLGFVFTTFVLLNFLLGGIQGLTWNRSMTTSLAATLGCYGVFEVWLKIRLPKGIFGF